MKAGLVAVVLLGVALGVQIVPFPEQPEGFKLGPATSNITLDVYYDHLCSDSAAAFPALYEYWEKHQDWLQLVIHIYPLPYHTYAFPVAQAGKFIQANYTDQFVNYLTYMFKNQNTYLVNALGWEWTTIMTRLAQDTETATGVPSSQVLAALNDEGVNWLTRVSWKYATTRNVPGTPIYFVNGVWVPDVTNYVHYYDWWLFFDTLSKLE